MSSEMPSWPSEYDTSSSKNKAGFAENLLCKQFGKYTTRYMLNGFDLSKQTIAKSMSDLPEPGSDCKATTKAI